MWQRFLTWQPSWQSLFKKVIFIEGLHWSSLACCKDFWHGNLLEKTCSRRWFYFKDQCFWIQIFGGRSGSGPRPLFRSNLLDKACSKRCFTSKSILLFSISVYKSVRKDMLSTQFSDLFVLMTRSLNTWKIYGSEINCLIKIFLNSFPLFLVVVVKKLRIPS